MRLRETSRQLIIPVLAVVCAVATLFPACEEDQTPPEPSALSKLSGDGQYSKKGTRLPEAFRVIVHDADGSAASGVTVRFQVTGGGGSLSRASATTDNDGLASSVLTLGPDAGVNSVRASLANDPTVYVDFSAEAGEFYCPEEDPTFSRKHAAAHDLYLFTRKSALNQQAGLLIAGVVRLQPQYLNSTFAGSGFRSFAEGAIINVPKDAAFSNSGDFYIAWAAGEYEVTRVPPTGENIHLATLETQAFLGSEVTRSPRGILVGCDEFGPFAIGCRDTLGRWDEADYGAGSCNNDAVAVEVDPQSPYYEDIYFIYLADSTLRRLPIDSLAATGPTEVVTTLTQDEAVGANGMAVAADGTIYVLVDTDHTKVIVKVTPGGARSIEYDFFDRGPDPAPGIQNDLAIDREFSFLFTVDTLNDVLLVYDINQQSLVTLSPDILTHPEAISTTGSFGERVGLVVLP